MSYEITFQSPDIQFTVEILDSGILNFNDINLKFQNGINYSCYEKSFHSGSKRCEKVAMHRVTSIVIALRTQQTMSKKDAVLIPITTAKE